MWTSRRFTSEASQLDVAAARQGVGDLVEYRRHDQFDSNRHRITTDAVD
jgi:hypothetical protein